MIEKIRNVVHGLKPVIIMVFVQFAYAGVNVFYKLAANDGMDLRVLVAYRFLFAAAFIVPIAFFLERKRRPKLTWTVVGQAFLCGLLGGSLCQNLYLVSLSLTSATFASAMANLAPAVTFIFAVSFRLERLALKTLSGKAKVLGTLIGIGGAMLLTFYKGVQIKLWPTPNLHLLNQSHGTGSHAVHDGLDRVWGALASLGGCFSYAAWLIVQAKMSEKYPDYSSTALMSVMGLVQSVVFALCVQRDWKEWKLGWDIRLLTVAYSGIVGSGVMFTLIAWCIRLRGPLFVSVFNPLMLVLVAVAGSLILDEKLYLGSVLGAVLIVLGLYVVLWGKGKEMKQTNKTMSRKESNEVMEIITSSPSVDEEIKSNRGSFDEKHGFIAWCL